MSAEFAEIAEALCDNGYTPIPVKVGEKRPAIRDWTRINYGTSPGLLRGYCDQYPQASTGIVLGNVCVIDIDVLDSKVASNCKNIVSAELGDAPCRFGKAPKCALFFRVDGLSFKKLATQTYTIDGHRAQVEILCDGQQVVVAGTHPDTREPYYWDGSDLLETPLSELPMITRAEAENLRELLEAELAAAAGGQDERPTGSSKSREGRNGFLYSKGCALRAEGADEEEMRLSLVELNQTATEKDHPNFSNGPIPEIEIDQIISSIVKHIPAGPNQEEAGLIRELNEKHAVVMIGGKCVIANEQFDPTFGHENITFSSPPDLIARYSNRFVGRGKNKITAGKAWLSHPERRQYEGIVFVPGQQVPGFLNLDRGFAVEPKKGNCSRFLEHIRNNICSADEDLSDYLLAWMADSVQNRAQRPGIAVVLRGRQGTGKGVLVNQFGSLFGQHFIQISQASHLTGNFNSHLKDKLIVYADEAFWAGDKKGEGVLKALITEGTIQIEMKGKDVLTFKNYIRLMVSSNNDWVIPAGNDERRFFVLDVGEARIQDRAYFGSVIDQMNSGGREALLQYLLDYDLNGISLGSPPSTQALSNQKHHSSSLIQKWWFERLMEGHITSDSSNWKPHIRSDELYQDYLSFVQHIGGKRLLPPSVLGKELKKLTPGLERVRVTTGEFRHWSYQIPDLEHCRRHYELITRHTWEWPEED